MTGPYTPISDSSDNASTAGDTSRAKSTPQTSDSLNGKSPTSATLAATHAEIQNNQENPYATARKRRCGRSHRPALSADA